MSLEKSKRTCRHRQQANPQPWESRGGGHHRTLRDPCAACDPNGTASAWLHSSMSVPSWRPRNSIQAPTRLPTHSELSARSDDEASHRHAGMRPGFKACQIDLEKPD